MLHNNKVDECKDNNLMYDVWVTYWGMHLFLDLPKHHIEGGKFYIATDKDGEIYVYSKPVSLLACSHEANEAAYVFKLGESGDCLPVCWKDSLVEYKL